MLRFLFYHQEILVNRVFNWQRCFTRKKNLLEKAAALKRFEYSLLDKQLKTQTSVAEKQYQGVNKLFKPDEKEQPITIKKEKQTMADKSKIVCDNKYSFSDYRNIRKYYDLSFITKYNKLSTFYHRLIEFRGIVPRTKETKN